MEDPDGIKEEYLRVHNLLKVARKRQIGKPGKGKAMSSMDNLETLPLAPWDGYALNQIKSEEKVMMIAFCFGIYREAF